MPYFATYAATKAFDLALAEGLAEELSQEPVDILALCPGATATDFQARAGAPNDMFDRAESSISVARKAMRALGRRRVLVLQFTHAVRPVLQHRNTSYRFQRRTRLFQTFDAARPERMNSVAIDYILPIRDEDGRTIGIDVAVRTLLDAYLRYSQTDSFYCRTSSAKTTTDSASAWSKWAPIRIVADFFQPATAPGSPRHQPSFGRTRTSIVLWPRVPSRTPMASAV